MIDKYSAIPVYFQIKEDIKNKILQGHWGPGQCIDSEREISEHYGVSRMTVRQAIGELVKEGILLREKGRGTFVCETRITQHNIMSFTEMTEKSGLTAETVLLDVCALEGDEELAELFGTKELLRIQRLRKADDTVIGFEQVYIPEKTLGDTKKEELQGSLFKLLEERGRLIATSHAFIKAVETPASLLEIFSAEEVSALLMTNSSYYDEGGELIFVEESYYNGEKFTLEVNIAKKQGMIL